MVDVGVVLAWVAMSAASLKGLSAFRRVSGGCAEADLALSDGDLAHEEFYPLDVPPLPVGGHR